MEGSSFRVIEKDRELTQYAECIPEARNILVECVQMEVRQVLQQFLCSRNEKWIP